MKLVERKKYNKIILISTVGTDMGGKKFITEAQRDHLVELWDEARTAHTVYDPVTYLTAQGFTIDDTYRTYFTSDPQTFYFPRAFQQNVYHLVMSTTYRQRTETNQVLTDYIPLAYGSYTQSSFFAKSIYESIWDYIAVGY